MATTQTRAEQKSAGAASASLKEFVLHAADARFERDADGTVWLRTASARQAVSSMQGAFPLTHRLRMISLRDLDGNEIAMLDEVRDLDAASARIVEQELQRSYFMPRITDIYDIHEAHNVVEWDVETDKGPRTFQVRGVRKNVRRIGDRRLVVKDVDGNRYEIRDWTQLSDHPQELLEPYL
jgi:hypothetical protein